MKLVIPKDYKPDINIKETQKAIKLVKDYFERELAKNLNLTRVSAPLFVKPESGLNDNLSGIERPVKFGLKEQNDAEVEIVHSLAKWKRMALKRYGFDVGEGIYTDMYAIRRDEETSNIHSILVDQWDWEKIIDKSQRSYDNLVDIVNKVYKTLKTTEEYIAGIYDYIEEILPQEITFVTSQELEDRFPGQTSKERENLICKEKGAVFITQIGGVLKSGERHDSRAPDYDDWTLNGDILVYYPPLDMAIEMSSMGIRVDEDALLRQLEISDCIHRAELAFQKALINKELPYTVGGGIGQSRMCMFYLRKAHISEVQVSTWTDEFLELAKNNNIAVL